MRSNNITLLIGHLGGDPEVKQVSADFKVAEFSLAVDDSYKNKSGQKIQKTQWIEVKATNNWASFVEKYYTKGTLVSLSGKLQTDQWNNSEGKVQRKTYLLMMGANFLPDGNKSSQPSQQNQSMGEPQIVVPDSDDLPF